MTESASLQRSDWNRSSSKQSAKQIESLLRVDTVEKVLGAAYTEPCLLLAIGFVNRIHVRTRLMLRLNARSQG